MKPLHIRNLILGDEIPKICIPMTGKNKEELSRELEYIRKFVPDLAEWRVDCLENQETVWEMLETISDNLGEIPLLFTFRTAREGGCREIMYEDYVKLLKQAAKSGQADILDVELFFCPQKAGALITELKSHHAVVLASNHHFHETPSVEQMVNYMQEMDACGADILKLAVMPRKQEDVLRLLMASLWAGEKTEKPVVTMSMGQMGMATRFLGEDFGSCITFAAGLQASAPGQIPAEKLRALLNTLHQLKNGKN
ncbi:MAG TPA: type I 3-dehydroquinate dehydratase [Candidatus Blautia stercoravium]|nr:type I 3-dehydroquinate dehydratase [Candidatus Blautia stercoravium]